MTADEVTETLNRGYDPRSVLAGDPELATILDQIRSGRFSPQQPDLFEPLVRSLAESDPFLVLAEFRSYADCQRQVARRWNDTDSWTRGAIQNVASMGRFSSDRAIRDYAREIWKLEPVAVKTPAGSGRS
jgi:starch phosphorylase